MTLIIFLIIAIGIAYFIYSSNKKNQVDINSSTSDSYSSSNNSKSTPETTKSYFQISKSVDEQYEKFSIHGISFCNIKISDIGDFEGYAKAELDNKYDKYAVSIFRDDGKRLGYAPGGSATLHSFIVDHGGKVYAYGDVYQAEEGYFYGMVNINFNSSKEII